MPTLPTATLAVRASTSCGCGHRRGKGSSVWCCFREQQPLRHSSPLPAPRVAAHMRAMKPGATANSEAAMQFPHAILVSVVALALSISTANARSDRSTDLSSASCAPLPSGAISWWPGDGSPSDCLGGLPTTVHGGVTYQSGLVGGSLAFDGTSAWVELPFTPAINFAPTAAFTIEAWARADGVGGAETGYRAILVKCPPSGLWDWGLYLTPDNRFMAGCQSGYAVT